MATSGADGVKGVVGGIFTLAVVAGVIYLKVVKAQNRAERREARDAAFEADHSLWKSHALDMMKQAPDAKGIGEYLAWGVETYHGEADEEAMSSFISDGAAYRDALIEKIYERARKDGPRRRDPLARQGPHHGQAGRPGPVVGDPEKKK